VWFGAMDLNTKLRKFLTGGHLTLRLLTWVFETELQMRKNLKLRNFKWKFHYISLLSPAKTLEVLC
jgi:hypothetical protein